MYTVYIYLYHLIWAFVSYYRPILTVTCTVYMLEADWTVTYVVTLGVFTRANSTEQQVVSLGVCTFIHIYKNKK